MTDWHENSNRIYPALQDFGSILSYLRKMEKLTQLDLAERIGVDGSFISRLEHNARTPDRDMVLKLARALRLHPVETDALLASAGFRPESLDDPIVRDLTILLNDDRVPREIKDEMRSIMRVAVKYGRLSLSSSGRVIYDY